MSSIFNPSEGRQTENDNKKLYRNITMQRLLRIGITVFGILLMLSLLAIAYAILIPESDSTSFTIWLLTGLALLTVSAAGLIVNIALQEKANGLFRNLLVVWHYNAPFLSRFLKMEARRRKATYSRYLLTAAAVCAALGALFWLLQPDISAMYLLLLIAAGLLLILAGLFHPIWIYFYNRLLCLFFGKRQQIVLSRTGLWMNGRFISFGLNITLYKVELQEIGSFKCLVFFLQSRRGYQLGAREITVPAPPSASDEELQELLAVYNSPDLLAGRSSRADV